MPNPSMVKVSSHTYSAAGEENFERDNQDSHRETPVLRVLVQMSLTVQNSKHNIRAVGAVSIVRVGTYDV